MAKRPSRLETIEERALRKREFFGSILRGERTELRVPANKRLRFKSGDILYDKHPTADSDRLYLKVLVSKKEPLWEITQEGIKSEGFSALDEFIEYWNYEIKGRAAKVNIFIHAPAAQGGKRNFLIA